MSDNKERYINLIKSIERPGIDNLLDFLVNKSDFFTAPASTKFHCSVPEGLLIHSLNVYDILEKKCQVEPFASALGEISDDSIKIVALLHDICKFSRMKQTIRIKKYIRNLVQKEMQTADLIGKA